MWWLREGRIVCRDHTSLCSNILADDCRTGVNVVVLTCWTVWLASEVVFSWINCVTEIGKIQFQMKGVVHMSVNRTRRLWERYTASVDRVLPQWPKRHHRRFGSFNFSCPTLTVPTNKNKIFQAKSIDHKSVWDKYRTAFEIAENGG